MTFYCNLLVEQSKPAVYVSETPERVIEDLMIFAFRINIEDTNDKDEVAVSDF
jgi:hypothetical protein